MAERTGIVYLDATWGVTAGCSPVGPACDHCWAEAMARRKAANPIIKEREDYQAVLTNGAWNGQVRLLANRLDWPLKWKQPKVIGVAFESDLWHEAVPDEFIDKVFAVMAASPHHSFVLLTKRPARALQYMTTPDRDEAVGWAAHRLYEQFYAQYSQGARWGAAISLIHRQGQHVHLGGEEGPQVWWPLPNVWLGVSVWDQASADRNIPLLLQTPAAHRWISYEPAISPWDPGRSFPCGYYCDPWPDGGGHHDHPFWTPEHTTGIDLVVIGCESGPGARPMNPEWARAVIAQCEAADVPVYLKQMTVDGKVVPLPELDGVRYDKLPWRVG